MRVLTHRVISAMLFPLLIVLACCSCGKEYLPDKVSLLVVEGWIEDGGSPVVMVTRSVPTVLETVSSDILTDYVVRWAKVTVSDGDNTIVLTGKPDKNYPTQYIYTTSGIKGESGRQYILNVSYHGAEAEAVTTIPEKVELETLSSVSLGGDRYCLRASFTDNPYNTDYYRFFSMIRGRETAFFPCLMGIFSDTNMSGTADCLVYPGNSISSEGFSPYFISGEEVAVKLCTMGKDMYDFWKGYEDQVSLSKNPLFPVTLNPSSNMNGALGYWAGYGTSVLHIRVGG